jgi:ectoine hydroxylase-related dioxygenase (phytanoyl-CoA dioxygenase family)
MAGGPVITPEQVAQYRRDGAILIKHALSEGEIALLERGLEEARAEPADRQSILRGAAGEIETLVEQFASSHCPSLKALIDGGRLAEIAGRLMAAPSAQLVLEQIFYKSRGHINPTPWHQDTPFMRVRGDDMARVWVACDSSPRALTVQIARGSHRWNVVYNTSPATPQGPSNFEEGKSFTYAGIGNDLLPPLPDVPRYRDSFTILSWDVEPGDAVVFNGNVLHGADGVDYHPSPRRALATTWGGPDVRYIHPQGNAVPSPPEILGLAVPHGVRIGDHEEAFAVGWRDPVAKGRSTHG